MKKIITWVGMLLVTLVALTACQSNTTNTTSSTATEKKTVTVTTSFLQDMVKQLAGDAVDTELIIPAGEDPHLYVAKSSDLEKLKKADLVLYHGLHFEGKMVEVLEKLGQPVSKDFPKDKIGVMEEDEGTVTDPHFWFDISLYKLATQEASNQLQQLLPDKADTIKTNTENYLKQLDELDAWNKEQLAQIPENSRYLVTPHDAFNYFSRAYNIPVHAPQGVSTQSEVANKDMVATVDLIIEHKIKAIFAESTTNPERMKKLQEAVQARGSDVKVVTGDGQELFSDSLAPAGQDGDTYIDMYKHNTKLMVDNLK